MVLPFLALFLTQKIGASPARAGTALLIYGIGSFLTSPVTGKISDKIGALKVMKYSLYGTGIMYLLFIPAQNYYVILILTFFLSVINEAFRPANLAMISEIVQPSQRRMSFALNRLAVNIGTSIGPVVGGFLFLIDYHLLFYVNAITSFSAGIYILFIKWDYDAISEKTTPEFPIIKESIFSDRKFLFFLAGITPATIVFFQLMGAVPLYIVNDLKYSTAAFGLFTAVNTVLIIIAEVPLNNMMSNVSYRKSMFWGAFLTAAGFGAMAFAKETIPLVITVIIWTFGEMIFFPVTASYISEIAPAERKGEYMGYFQMTFSFAFSMGPWLGTIVYQNYGAFNLWIATFIFASLSAIMMLFLKAPRHDNLQINNDNGS